MLKFVVIIMFVSYSGITAAAVERGIQVKTEQLPPAVPPIVRSVADAAEAFAYCAERAAYHAKRSESSEIDAAWDFAYCASIAHYVKIAHNSPLTACSITPALTTCDDENNCGIQKNNKTAAAVAESTTPTPNMPAITISDKKLGYEYSAVTEHFYKLHTEEVSWSVAERACRREGALLAVLNSREEALVLSDLVTAKIPDWEYVSIGIFRVIGTELWRTVTGETVEESGYNTWGPGQSRWTDDMWSYGRLSREGACLDPGIHGVARAFICEMVPESNLN